MDRFIISGITTLYDFVLLLLKIQQSPKRALVTFTTSKPSTMPAVDSSKKRTTKRNA